MKFHTSRSELAAMAGWAARAITDTKSMPILGGMLIEAGQQVSLAAFNYDNMHRGRIGAQVDEPAEVLVPGLHFANLISNLQGATVEVMTEGQELLVRSGRAEIRFHTMPREQYPELPAAGSGNSIVNGEAFADALAALAPLALRESTIKPWEQSVFIHAILGRGLQIYCGTSYIIGRTFLAADVAEDFEVMVPARRLADACKGFEGELAIGVTDGRLWLSAPDQWVSMRTYDDGYPTVSVEALFREPVSDTFTLPTPDLRDAIKLMAPAGDLAALEFSEGGLEVSSANNDVMNERAQVTDTIPCEASGSGRRLLALKYLLPAILGPQDETLEIDLMPRRNLMTVRGSAFEYVMVGIREDARAIND